jgi:hypothetical protein
VSQTDTARLLAQRYLAACETIYSSAIARADEETAVHIVRGALSIAITSAIDLDPESNVLAITWYERLTLLYDSCQKLRNEVARTLKWASTRLPYMLNQSAPTEDTLDVQ